MSALIVLPVVIPLATAAVMLIAWRSQKLQRILGVLGMAGLLAAGIMLLIVVYRDGIQVAQIGSWPAPFGITLVADLFSAIMVVLAGVMGLVVAIYALGSIDAPRQEFGYFPLLHILLMGVCGAFLTGDIFNLYVWFEVMLIASFVLLVLGGEKEQILGGIKYVTLNLLSSALFLAAVGLLYGAAGTLNLADLAVKLRFVEQPGLITILSVLFLVAFGIKAAIFPLFFWLPASYHTPHVTVSAIFSSLLTKVGVYAIIRVFTLLFLQDVAYTHTLILIIAGFTMITGVLGAVAQYEFRRLLSFHIISQIGYLLMGLGMFSIPALAGAVFFMAHVILSKSALFLVSGVTERIYGSYELKKLGGAYRDSPALAILFLIPAFSLAGIPPLSGFFAKLALIQAGLRGEQYIIVAAALGVSILTLYSMVKIWNEAFWKSLPDRPGNPGRGERYRMGNGTKALLLPVAILAAFIVIIGLAAEPFYALSIQAAGQLMDPAGYVQAVIGGQ